MKCVAGAVFFFLSFTYAFTTEYVYEFGYDVGDVLYVKDGRILPFTPTTKVTLPIPFGNDVSYIKVTVDALGPPKVHYDDVAQSVTITYSWTQISDSTYNVLVKAVPLRQ